MSGSYPPYFNATQTTDGFVVVSVRSEPKVRDGSHVCSFQPGPGRCTAGGPTCNNYCNMHPDKTLKMQDHPMPCQQISEGSYATIRIPSADWVAMGLPLPPF